MRKPKIKPGQLWRFTDYRRTEHILLVIDLRYNDPATWNVFNLSKGQPLQAPSWDREYIMMSSKHWEFIQ